MEAEVQFAVVEHHISPWDAHITRALLESEGIPAFLANEHHVWANWPMSLMLGGVRLLVRAEHYELATATLAMRDRGELEAALMSQHPPISLTCTNCGSSEFSDKRDWPSLAIAAIFLLTLKIIYPPVKHRKCAACGQLH